MLYQPGSNQRKEEPSNIYDTGMKGRELVSQVAEELGEDAGIPNGTRLQPPETGNQGGARASWARSAEAGLTEEMPPSQGEEK